jgi:hypothetical protein
MIDLVITGVVMPKMSGPRLAKNLASLRPDLKVLSPDMRKIQSCEKAWPTWRTTSCRSRFRCGCWREKSAKCWSNLRWRAVPVRAERINPPALV